MFYLQLNEASEMEAKACSELHKIREKLSRQNSHLSQLELHLQQSRTTEKELTLSMHNMLNESVEKIEANMRNAKSHMEEGEEEEDDDDDGRPAKRHRRSGVQLPPLTQKYYQQLIDKYQLKENNMERELHETKVNLNDLILEIEAVANEEEKTRTQNKRLLLQVNENVLMQKGILEENLRLQQQVDYLKKIHSDIESRYACAYIYIYVGYVSL